VTVPAYFGEDQRRTTQAACEIAGLRLERTINEPIAALPTRTVVVHDLGGGTFDVSVQEVTEGIIEILG
jgi:molecular chaperone DnaK